MFKVNSKYKYDVVLVPLLLTFEQISHIAHWFSVCIVDFEPLNFFLKVNNKDSRCPANIY